MLAHLEPSVELTGGPWYTDNELDTEFIKLLSTACLHYIRDRVRALISLQRYEPFTVGNILVIPKTVRKAFLQQPAASICDRCCAVLPVCTANTTLSGQK